ncbi:MAG: hypothetical protein PHE02_12055 [Lachnospiraceae bacterium]|nr:hypothetical protein [Lachnospiraceae bacterium]
MKETKDYKLDKMELKDIQDQITHLAKSYTPEWKFDTTNPDIGSVIALVFSEQTMENKKRFNTFLDRFHTEFANMMGISLLPAQPAQTMISMGLIQDTIPGTYVPKGTKLLSGGENENVVFETSHPVYVTNSKLTNIYMVSGEDGRIIPILGRIPVPSLFKEEEANEVQEEEGFVPFHLFQYKEQGVQKNAIIFYHKTIFDVENETIYMDFQGESVFLEELSKGTIDCVYLSEKGVLPVEELQVDPGRHRIMIRKRLKCHKTEAEGYCALAFIARNPILEDMHFSRVLFASSGEERIPDFVGNGNTDLIPTDFNPFGDTLALFSECFIACDDYFAKAGARVKIRFQMEILEHTVRLSKQQEDEELKIIKRKPRTITSDVVGECYAEEISIEYYNGNGWKRLECDRNYNRLFENADGGMISISFLCPSDWESITNSGYEGRAIRIQLLKSDNCYLIPCNHHYPHLENMKISYSYEERYEPPEKVECIYQTKKVDISNLIASGKTAKAFSKSDYISNALYMGFDKKFENGPVSIYFKMQDDMPFMGTDLEFRYSTINGFKKLRVVDHMRKFTKSGTIRFMPPEDMAMASMEGIRRYWIMLVDDKRIFREDSGYRPKIQQIQMNVVEASNIETLAEESYYMDTVTAHMKFQLNASNILDADVWVNEKSRMTQRQMKQMLREYPARTRAEYDFMGNIQEFYVLWTEVDSFEQSVSTDRHYMLDRIRNQIMFGDGIHVMIPRELDGTAFQIIIRSCEGVRGNVEVNTIQESLANINYIDNISNITMAYGGTNLETVDSALSRSANMLSSRKRLVTQNDYIREVHAMSDNIDKVKCIVGRSADGSFNVDYISIVILMKDYGRNAYSFYKLLPLLQKHLQENCEITVLPANLQIVEPIAMELSVEIWTGESKDETDFEIQEKFREGLRSYLDPVTGNRGNGWEIGEVPKKAQIMMKLNSMKTGAMIRKMAMNVKYTDAQGVHECDIDHLPENPFFICKSGAHKIHIFTQS